MSNKQAEITHLQIVSGHNLVFRLLNGPAWIISKCLHENLSDVWLSSYSNSSFHVSQDTSTIHNVGSDYLLHCPLFLEDEFKLFLNNCCSLEIFLEPWEKSNTWAFIFFKNFQVYSDMHLNFKKWLQIFLFDSSFGDIEFYCFSVDQSWFNGIKWVIVT